MNKGMVRIWTLLAVAGLVWLWWWAFKRWPLVNARLAVSIGVLCGLLVTGFLFHQQVSMEELKQLGMAIGAML